MTATPLAPAHTSVGTDQFIPSEDEPQIEYSSSEDIDDNEVQVEDYCF